MSRLPVRWKVTLAFASALLVVLTAVGAFLYLRFDAELSQTLDRGLRSRSGELAAFVADSPSSLPESGAATIEVDESFAQILSADGAILDAAPRAAAGFQPPPELRRARSGAVFADRPGDAQLDEATRLLAVPVSTRDGRRIVVVGASLDEKNQALSTLLVLELIGLTAALLLAAGAGYVVAGVALRPVEAMRRRAQEVTDQPDRRLPVPPVDDELGRLGATLNAMLDRLQAAGEAEREAIAKERRFVADASHELRTPLTILKSEIEVALLGPRRVPELEAALASTAEETDRLCRLAEDLLVLAQADDGRLPTRPERLALDELLPAVAGRHRAAFAAAGRELTVEAPAGLSVMADGLQVEQAITNLLDNALRHGSGRVELEGAGAHDGVSIVVRDHGTGFPPGFAERAFERFSRPDAGRTGGGAGLGLAIVRAIAEAHEGTVVAENAEPGARVELRLRSSSSHG